MPGRPPRIAVLAALALASLAAAGCGEREEIVHEGETEGIYLDVGGLDYQVQISRQINPTVVPDDAYVDGLPDFVSPPTEDETWFGVFIRVQNQTAEPQESAAEITITDTQGNEYKPLPLDPDENAFAYEPQVVAPGETLPSADSSGSLGSAQGALLLFKVTYGSLGNRPLELEIHGGAGEAATVDLDI